MIEIKNLRIVTALFFGVMVFSSGVFTKMFESTGAAAVFKQLGLAVVFMILSFLLALLFVKVLKLKIKSN